MDESQWNALLHILSGKLPVQPPAGFIIDSPWLPGWHGISTLQYYSSEKLWFESNLNALRTFPGVMFLPGFWSEFGMCTEPSAFGAKTIWTQNALPHADHIISDITEVDNIREPNPKTDGLLPFVIQRLLNCQPQIQAEGYQIKFAIARGPLNIASFLMGTTELMMAMIMDPDRTHRLLEKITLFSVNWLQLQKETFPSIDGILVLDDIVGFVGDYECTQFALPYLKRIFAAFDSSVRFFHNDAQGLVSTPYLKDMGVNLFNFSFEHSMQEIRDLAGPDVTLLGNLPPRDVLAAGSPAQVFAETQEMFNSIADKRRIIWSVGGGMPPGVPTENIHAFLEALKQSQ
jgi:uroporphyrinogen-III decarboxylase